EREDGITVGLPGGDAVPASLVGRDPRTDVAVLRAQATGLAAAPWAPPDDLRVGHLLVAVGRPGRTVRAAFGFVSALGPMWAARAGAEIDTYLEADLTAVPGFSGGVLLDATGKARALTTTGLTPRGISGVTLPTLRRVVDVLLTYGRIRRAFLGVGAQPVHLPVSLAGRANQEEGLLIIGVEPESPAERAGLLLGDTIVALDGKPVRGVRELLAQLGEAQIGTSVPVRILRGGEVQDRTVLVGERR
ncbi:MAG TPA: trypsin-like peptidase domain-containing protein, partial [bacterium]|nr:trypsin-like peptidase domain-containing protein [bacterium]